MDNEKLAKQLRIDEGVVKSAGLHVVYKDHLGWDTIGIGRLVDRRKGGGLTDDEVEYLLQNDIKEKLAQLKKQLNWFPTLPEPVQRALCNMCFQLGIDGLLGFKTTLKYIQAGNYKEAAKNARNSLWYKQTPERAERVCKLMESAK